jgi:hypothetical protein
MSAAQSVIGYVPDAVAKELQHSGKIGRDTIEVPLEAGKQGSLLRVRHADVAELRLGPSRDGHTGIQIVLNPGAQYETVHTSNTDLTALRDPGLFYHPWPGPIVIYIRPRFTPSTKIGEFHAVKE